jgi:hypothetical protein
MGRSASVLSPPTRGIGRVARLLRALVSPFSTVQASSTPAGRSRSRQQRHNAPTELRFAVDGKHRVLDLTPVRERLGKHWPRYADSVFLVAEKVVRREIGPKDRLSRKSDALIIAFEAPNSRAAAVIQTKVSKTLTQLLFGDGMFADAIPRRALASPPRRAARARTRGGFFRWLGALFGRFQAPAPAPAIEKSAADGPSGAGAEPASAAAPSVEPPDLEWAEKENAPAGSAAPPRAAARAISGQATRPALPLARFAAGNDKDVRQIEWAIFNATLRAARANAEFGAAVEERLSQVRFTYQPLWHVPSRALVSYRCTPVLVDQDNFIEGDKVLPNPVSVDQLMVLDQLALTNIIVDIEAMLNRNLDSVLVVPLHFTSFTADWSSGALSSLCNHIPAEARKRLVVEITDAATGRTDARFPPAVRALRPYCSRLGVVTPLRTRDFRYWAELGFLTAATDVTDWGGSEADLIGELDRFTLSARRDGLRAVVFGLRTRSLILAAATMGVEFVHGDPISQLGAMGVMERMPFDFADLYDA